jgi:valyl-tRNA synthetase
MYDPDLEETWRKYWEEKKLFLFDENSEKPIYIIDTPPPFTNGALHMGHVFWVSYIDSLARYKRMRGFNVLYPQGWDAHGFPTELAVEKKYGKGKLGREEFYQKCVEESLSNIHAMKVLMLKLGATFDQRHEYITTSDEYMSKVQLSVLEMYDKGFVYRAMHPVEWCTSCRTTISREQAEEKEEDSLLNYVEFKVNGTKKSIMIATSRPELLHACVAIAVNPKDERFAEFVGKKIEIPLFDRSVELIADESVDPAFGTGAEMVCTFGDRQDVSLYYKHKLRMIEAMSDSGLLKNAGKFNGMDLNEARKSVTEALKESGHLKKQEKLKHTIKEHDRCHTAVELLSSMQWFIRIKEHSEKIKELASEIKWVPDFARQRLVDWSNFIDWDWAISRNRIFGTPIPFWYCEKCGETVPAEKGKLPVDPVKHKPPIEHCQKCKGKLVGESLTLDGWIDSSITPLVISGWPDKRSKKMAGFPIAVRIQGTEIIRTWAFYTIFRTWALTGSKPWENIIAHSMILGIDGREMHKSWGNGVYPDKIMEKYTTDAIRLWVALCGGIVKDKAFSYQDMDYAKTFNTKLYNTANFIQLALGKEKLPKEEPHNDLNIFDLWIINRFNTVAKEVTEAYEKYMLYDAMSKCINFYWHEFADYYIENVKHRVYSTDKRMEKSKHAALFTLKYICINSIKLLAPVIPHICEEINFKFDKESIFLKEWPRYSDLPKGPDYVLNGVVYTNGPVHIEITSTGAMLNAIIAEVRRAKASVKKALNYEISSININVPEEYYTATLSSKEELMQICKARKVEINKGKYSVEVKI